MYLVFVYAMHVINAREQKMKKEMKMIKEKNSKRRKL